MTRRFRQKGFTIIELLVAMAAFSAMALIASITVLQIGKMYYKGAVSINTQETARSVLALISEQVQFTKGPVQPETTAGTFKSFCVGANRYTYVLNRILKPGPVTRVTTDGYSEDTIPHVLWHDQRPDPNGSCDPVNLADENLSGGRELLSESMRLKDFSITAINPTLASISVGVIYGDGDLIEMDSGSGMPIGCKGSSAGSQWCAMSNLNTQVFRRLT